MQKGNSTFHRSAAYLEKYRLEKSHPHKDKEFSVTDALFLYKFDLPYCSSAKISLSDFISPLPGFDFFSSFLSRRMMLS